MNPENRRLTGSGVRLAFACRLELSVIVVLAVAAAVTGELAYLVL